MKCSTSELEGMLIKLDTNVKITKLKYIKIYKNFTKTRFEHSELTMSDSDLEFR